MRKRACAVPVSSTAVAAGGEVGTRSDKPVARLRHQIGSKLARVARRSARRSLRALGSVRSWASTSRVLLRGEAERADDPDGASRFTPGSGEAHLIAVERGCFVWDEDAVGEPRGEVRGGVGVGVEGGGRTGQDQVDGVMGVRGLERGPRLFVDHVIGRGGHRREVGPRRGIGFHGREGSRARAGLLPVEGAAESRIRCVLSSVMFPPIEGIERERRARRPRGV